MNKLSLTRRVNLSHLLMDVRRSLWLMRCSDGGVEGAGIDMEQYVDFGLDMKEIFE